MSKRHRRHKPRRTTLMDNYCSRLGVLVDRKRAEVALLAARRNAERTAEVAAGASRAKTEFLAKMSHEIRTPMNGVLGMTDLLSRSELSDRQRKFVDAAHRSGETLLHVIDDILDFSRIESGKLQLDSVDFDIHDIVSGVVELLSESAQKKGLEILYVISKDVPQWVTGDSSRLRQIIFNLFGNAIKFTDHGEVSLRVDTDHKIDGKIKLSFEIADTGIGIAPASIDHILKPFEQADGSITRRFGGTGLGLPIARQLIEMMAGDLRIESEPGSGSKFQFTVNLDIPNCQPETDFEDKPNLRGTKILIVDDNTTNREILHYYIAEWSARSDSAADGSRALQLLTDAAANGEPYDVVLLDMMMPEMSGVDVVRAMKASASLSATPLLILTSMGRHNDASDEAILKDIPMLMKPIRYSELYNQLKVFTGDKVGDSSSSAISSQDLVHQIFEGRLTVLLAEDNPVNQEVAYAFLTALGCEVDVVSSGREVLSALERRSYHIVFMDCQMPDMDGFQATAELRRREKHQDSKQRIPIIAITANVLPGERERCLSSGMDDYMSKPFNQDELLKMLERWAPQGNGEKSYLEGRDPIARAVI